MPWEHFMVQQDGICRVRKKGTEEIIECEYELGVIYTGRSRVFWGYQILLKIGDITITGRSKGCSETYTLALEDCNKKLESEGLVLLVAGNSDKYYETPMSGASGFGYIEGQERAVPIMFPFDLQSSP